MIFCCRCVSTNQVGYKRETRPCIANRQRPNHKLNKTRIQQCAISHPQQLLSRKRSTKDS